MVCTTVTVTAVSTCASIAKDTWKPETLNPKSGINLPFVLRSTNPNKAFRLYYEAGIPKLTQVVIEAVTDAQGCYTGEIIALPDGTYTIYMCYPLLGICTYGSAQVIVTWGSKPMSWQTMALIGAGILGLAYIIGQQRRE